MGVLQYPVRYACSSLSTSIVSEQVVYYSHGDSTICLMLFLMNFSYI